MALKYITFFALLAMATACDLKRSHAFPTRVFENYNNGQFEDFNDAFHRDSLEWVNGNSANGLFSGATSVSDIQAIDAALGNPTFTLDSVTKKSDSESAFYGSFAGFAFSGFFEYHHCRISHARIWVEANGAAFTFINTFSTIVDQTPFTDADSQDDDDDNTSERLFDTSYTGDDDDSTSSSDDDDSSYSSSWENDSSYCSSSSSSSSDDEEMMAEEGDEMMAEEGDDAAAEEGDDAAAEEGEEMVKRTHHKKHHKKAHSLKKQIEAAVTAFKRSSDDDDDDSSSSSSSSSSYDCDPTSVARDHFRSFSCHDWHHLASLYSRSSSLSINGDSSTINNGEGFSASQLKCVGKQLGHFRFHVDSVIRRKDEEVAVRAWLETAEGLELPFGAFMSFTDRCRISAVNYWFEATFSLAAPADSLSVLRSIQTCV